LKPPAPRKGTVISTAVSDRGQVAKDNSDGLKDVGKFFDVHSNTSPPAKEKSSIPQAEIAC
jgi:hypothetical protein